MKRMTTSANGPSTHTQTHTRHHAEVVRKGDRGGVSTCQYSHTSAPLGPSDRVEHLLIFSELSFFLSFGSFSQHFSIYEVVF